MLAGSAGGGGRWNGERATAVNEEVLLLLSMSRRRGEEYSAPGSTAVLTSDPVLSWWSWAGLG